MYKFSRYAQNVWECQQVHIEGSIKGMQFFRGKKRAQVDAMHRCSEYPTTFPLSRPWVLYSSVEKFPLGNSYIFFFFFFFSWAEGKMRWLLLVARD